MRIGIVNDLSLAREALRRVVASSPDDRVAWIAADGEEAVELARKDPPDLILMDLIMPRVDGVEATRRILATNPCPILIVTSSVSGNIAKVYEAMGHGAIDAVDTPTIAQSGLTGSEPILRKIRRIERMYAKTSPTVPRPEATCSGESPRPASPRLVAIGSSTGGPKALTELLGQLPGNLRVPVVIVQHVDPAFAPGMAAWLTRSCALPVQMAHSGIEPRPGHVYLAHTDQHLHLDPDGRFKYSPEPAACHYKPSVDAFFLSLCQHAKGSGIAVLLTGMGRDGAEGLLSLRRKGWITIAQDQASSSIYGMPKAAAELQAATHILDPTRIGRLVAETCGRRVS